VNDLDHGCFFAISSIKAKMTKDESGFVVVVVVVVVVLQY
jgi:hypothetical protein